jgi:hypothetical protein
MALLAAQACARTEDYEPGLQVKPIIYGEDDRRDVGDVAEPWAALATHTAVALIAQDHLRADGNEYIIDAPSYAEARSLCPGERFSDQPAAAGCSGVLLTDSIVATAAHCLGVIPDGSADCANNRYVLGFAQRGESAPIRVPTSQVFGAKAAALFAGQRASPKRRSRSARWISPRRCRRSQRRSCCTSRTSCTTSSPGLTCATS